MSTPAAALRVARPVAALSAGADYVVVDRVSKIYNQGTRQQVEAVAPSSFAIDQILAYPFPENLTASKTDSAIAWTLNERGLRNIYVAEGPEFRPRRLTTYSEDDGRELADLSFSDDGRYLVYVRGSNRDANSPQVWSITIEDGMQKRLSGPHEDATSSTKAT